MNQTKLNLSTFFYILWCVFFLNSNFFSGLETAFHEDRYVFGVLSTCENVRENFEEILPRLDRLCQIWHIGRLGPMLFRAPES